jgi:hypothetical protein
VLVSQIALFESAGEFGVEDLLKEVLEAPVIGFEDRVLGR